MELHNLRPAKGAVKSGKRIINLNRLESISEKYRNSNIDIEFLVTNGIVNKGDKVKILGTGELKSNLTITAHAVSASAKESIEKSGGTITIA